jgi:hypothetical protein
MEVAEINVDVLPESKGSIAADVLPVKSKGSKSKGSKSKGSRSDSNNAEVRVEKSKSKSKKSLSKSKRSALRRFTEKRAAKTVGKFMKKTGSKRKAEFLKAICSDSGVCIAFGKERKKIFDFFKGFTQFDYLTDINAIGAASANGFIKELEYKHKDYVAHAILKSSRKKDADNLMYEYYAGLLINFLLIKLPCFVETYGHFEYKTDADRKAFQAEKSGFRDLSKILTLHKPSEIKYKESCENSINQCILIQHIKGAKSIGDKVYKGVPDYEFIANDLLYSLYQIYIGLAWKRSVFTHYDLHPENVILYKPVEGKYIQFHYHVSAADVISFKSQYIAKMIDYGRSFIKLGGPSNSETYYDHLCDTPSCNVRPEQCGDESGYAWLIDDSLTEDNYYISSRINNVSHDLRLLKDLWSTMPWYEKPFSSNVKLFDMFQNILGRVIYKGKNGTPPVNGKSADDGKIEDVVDAESHIRRAIKKKDQVDANDTYYSGMEKLGDMHLYGNKPMEFIPAG